MFCSVGALWHCLVEERGEHSTFFFVFFCCCCCFFFVGEGVGTPTYQLHVRFSNHDRSWVCFKTTLLSITDKSTQCSYIPCSFNSFCRLCMIVSRGLNAMLSKILSNMYHSTTCGSPTFLAVLIHYLSFT